MRRFSFVWVVFLTAACQATAAEVKITVEEPSGVERKGWPVTSGIPFAEGALSHHQTSALFAPENRGQARTAQGDQRCSSQPHHITIHEERPNEQIRSRRRTRLAHRHDQG